VSYINKEEAINIIRALPIADFNGIEMCSKKRILKAFEFLPETQITTKLRRDMFSQIYCQSCEKIIPIDARKVKALTYCPHCGLKISEFKF
jgi:redox-regulated HSP33 family molecular chaperone